MEKIQENAYFDAFFFYKTYLFACNFYAPYYISVLHLDIVSAKSDYAVNTCMYMYRL